MSQKKLLFDLLSLLGCEHILGGSWEGGGHSSILGAIWLLPAKSAVGEENETELWWV